MFICTTCAYTCCARSTTSTLALRARFVFFCIYARARACVCECFVCIQFFFFFFFFFERYSITTSQSSETFIMIAFTIKTQAEKIPKTGINARKVICVLFLLQWEVNIWVIYPPSAVTLFDFQ